MKERRSGKTLLKLGSADNDQRLSRLPFSLSRL
jgi:hypothetical protein